jgi:hypothetical protein
MRRLWISSLCLVVTMVSLVAITTSEVAAASVTQWAFVDTTQPNGRDELRGQPSIDLTEGQYAIPTYTAADLASRGKMPKPRLICSPDRHLSFSLQWRVDALPPSVAALSDYLTNRFKQVTIDNGALGATLISDSRILEVTLSKGDAGYWVESHLSDQDGIDLLTKFMFDGLVSLSTVDGDQTLDWTLDFRDAARAVSKVVAHCSV